MLAGLSISSSTGRLQRFDFRFSQGAFRDDEIFDSALSVPGRFLLEVGRRLLGFVPDADWLVIGNPLLPLKAEQLAGWLDGGIAGPMVVTDRATFPVFYILPRRLFGELERFLLLLSSLDAGLDARLLALLSGVPVGCRQLDLEPIGESLSGGPNGWINGDQRLQALKLQCGNAITNIENRHDWKSLPFVNFFPMHAGDVLLMAVASRSTAQMFISKQVVCASYMDIPEACGSRLESVRLDMPWLPRDYSVSEFTYFAQAMEKLGKDFARENFTVFSRIIRLYYLTPFHLVDHARFALGDSILSFEETLHAKPAAVEARCQLPLTPLRVLFHLNGGWGLKTYPDRKIRALIGILQGLGIAVTVIGRPDLQDSGAQSVESKDSNALRHLIEMHHLFVGVDSFPHHFARLVAGWPTVGLFGNTQPRNSDARHGEGYRSSVLTLACNRCGVAGLSAPCPIFGTKDCANYAPPEQVAADILDLAREIYGYEA